MYPKCQWVSPGGVLIWVRSWKCSCLVAWFCCQLIAKPGNKTAAPSWPDPYTATNLCHHDGCRWPGISTLQDIKNHADQIGWGHFNKWHLFNNMQSSIVTVWSNTRLYCIQYHGGEPRCSNSCYGFIQDGGHFCGDRTGGAVAQTSA